MTLGRASPHESGALHVDGSAIYVDDIRDVADVLVGLPVVSPWARADRLRVNLERARTVPNVVAVLGVQDVPGDGQIGPIVHDEPVFADGEVHFCGQTLALVLATDMDAARRGAAAVEFDACPLPAITSIASAVEHGSFHGEPHVIERGDWSAALEQCVHRVKGSVHTGAQDHFYLETHASLAIPQERGDMLVICSTQHPTGVQAAVARVLGLGRHQVRCEVRRLGGGFGGKESQAETFAVLAALGAQATGRPVKIRLDRGQDMRWTGKRHPFAATYDLGFDADARLVAACVQLYSDGGWSLDLSGPVLDRALLHLDNAYFIPALRFAGRVCKTNLASNTAFRGFGGPQGVMVIEQGLNELAEQLGLDPAEIRRRNFYGAAPRNRAPYGQLVETPLVDLWDRLAQRSKYAARRQTIEREQPERRFVRRGIGMSPVKFGISFTKSLLNQAGALVLVYADGTVQLNHGGTEMGQGLHSKMLAVCSHELGVSLDRIRIMPTSTDKVPNTSATAASSGSDLNGAAVREACIQLRERMAAVAASMLGDADEAHSLRFADNRVSVADGARSVTFAEVATQAWIQRVSLSATGYYATPGIHYDETVGQGTPFYYYACGAAVTEVEVNALTGEYRVVRVDILHDVGRSLVPGVDRGQIEGGFVQGLGWLTTEELHTDDTGHVRTAGPSTYKIPAAGDVPTEFVVDTYEPTFSPAIYGSKAVGEPPLMLAISAVVALRHAIASWGSQPASVELRLPATPEAVFWAIEAAKRNVHATTETG